MNDDFFEVQCTICAAIEQWGIDEERLTIEKAEQVFIKRGWLFDKKRTLCPDCQKSQEVK